MTVQHKILVITSTYDKTVDYMEKKFGVSRFYRLNVDDFSSYHISFDRMGFSIENHVQGKILEIDCKSIYYRKPTPENLNNIIEKKYHNHCYREVFALVDGIVEAFRGRCLSKPSLTRLCDNKIYQARQAQENGFLLPEFLITNNSTAITQLDDKIRIVKPLASGTILNDNKKEFVQTNILDRNKKLDFLKYSPSYFQTYMEKDAEARVTIVDTKAYPIKIISKDKVDWRKPNNDICYSITTMPNDIYTKCIEFMKRFNMNFGCFDFIIKDDIWYFLEMNANGQWAWLEFKTKIDISSAIMSYLENV